MVEDISLVSKINRNYLKSPKVLEKKKSQDLMLEDHHITTYMYDVEIARMRTVKRTQQYH